MNKKLFTIILAGAVFTMALLPGVSMAGKGRVGAQGVQGKTKSTLQTQSRQKLRDGSCLTPGSAGSGAVKKNGNTYGPGDGTGNDGVGPKDGTGYGAAAR